MLTVDHIALRMEWSVRTARRYVAAWAERQRDPRIPRVRSLHTGRRGRPRYVVDPQSFERWLCPAQAEAA